VAARIAFLRAVNLGSRQVRMTRLVEIFAELGYAGAWTHVNSGNVVFEAAGARGAVERRIETRLEADLGFEVTTFVRTATELHRILADAPFTVAAGDTYFVTFLKDALSSAQREALEAESNDFDTLVVRGRDVHWRMHGRSTETRVGGRRWAAIVGDKRSTSRNTTMLRKLVDKIDASA
jgi:uncharacterized protein (DUF1697 family)